MGLSLADAAVRGMKSDKTIADQKQALLSAGDTEGLISLNHTLFGCATMMAKEDDADDDADDDDDDADDGDDDDDDGDDDDDDKDEDDKGKKRKPDPKDVRIQELSAEAKKKRLRIRTQAEKIADLEAENARLKKGKVTKKAKEDDEDDADDSAEDSEAAKALETENKALKDRLTRQTIRQEFVDIVTAPKAKIKFKDNKVAFKLLDLDDVEVDEDDGEIDGLEDAIKDLAKKSPYLLADKDEKDDDDEDERPRRTGQPTNRNRKSRKTANREALVKKYGMNR